MNDKLFDIYLSILLEDSNKEFKGKGGELRKAYFDEKAARSLSLSQETIDKIKELLADKERVGNINEFIDFVKEACELVAESSDASNSSSNSESNSESNSNSESESNSDSGSSSNSSSD